MDLIEKYQNMTAGEISRAESIRLRQEQRDKEKQEKEKQVHVPQQQSETRGYTVSQQMQYPSYVPVGASQNQQHQQQQYRQTAPAYDLNNEYQNTNKSDRRQRNWEKKQRKRESKYAQSQIVTGHSQHGKQMFSSLGDSSLKRKSMDDMNVRKGDDFSASRRQKRARPSNANDNVTLQQQQRQNKHQDHLQAVTDTQVSIPILPPSSYTDTLYPMIRAAEARCAASPAGVAAEKKLQRKLMRLEKKQARMITDEQKQATPSTNEKNSKVATRKSNGALKGSLVVQSSNGHVSQGAHCEKAGDCVDGKNGMKSKTKNKKKQKQADKVTLLANHETDIMDRQNTFHASATTTSTPHQNPISITHFPAQNLQQPCSVALFNPTFPDSNALTALRLQNLTLHKNQVRILRASSASDSPATPTSRSTSSSTAAVFLIRAGTCFVSVACEGTEGVKAEAGDTIMVVMRGVVGTGESEIVVMACGDGGVDMSMLLVDVGGM